MAKTNAQHQKAWRDRERDKRKDYMSERKQLFADFGRAFPEQIVVNYRFEEMEDLTNPIRVQIRYPTAQKTAIIAFAHDRDLDVERLFNLLAEELALRMGKLGMISDVPRTLIE